MKTLLAKEFVNTKLETYVDYMFDFVYPNTLAIAVDLTANKGFSYGRKSLYGRLQL